MTSEEGGRRTAGLGGLGWSSPYPNVSPFGGEVDSWTYDTIGNRLSETINGNPVSYSYPVNSELLSSVGTTTFTHNGNKSITQKTTPPDLITGFTWDVRNKLASTSFGGNISTYNYDFRGRRFGKTVSGVASTYLYVGQNLTADTTSGTTSEFLFAPGIDKPLAAYIAGSAYYYSVDGLGSVSLLTDSAGTVQNGYVYDVWGKTRSQTVNVPQPFVYTARETGENGLLYYRARYYSPEIGRFIGEDPVRYLDYSLYAYVGNDPVNFIDPEGLQQRGMGPLSGNDPLIVKAREIAEKEGAKIAKEWLEKEIDNLVKQLEELKKLAKEGKACLKIKDLNKWKSRLEQLRGAAKVIPRYFIFDTILLPPEIIEMLTGIQINEES